MLTGRVAAVVAAVAVCAFAVAFLIGRAAAGGEEPAAAVAAPVSFKEKAAKPRIGSLGAASRPPALRSTPEPTPAPVISTPTPSGPGGGGGGGGGTPPSGGGGGPPPEGGG